MSNVNVVVRFRPQNALENAKGGNMCVRFDDNKKTVVVEGGDRIDTNGPLTFTFDRVFDPTVTQQMMYDNTAKPIVEDVLKGYNGTIFAYGQTGSGKTHTMEGPDIDDSKMKGMIPRIIENLFMYIATAPENLEFSIRVSYFEIYLEKIKDLLDESKDNLQVHEDKARGVYIKGLTEVYVASPDEVMAIMRKGKSNRAVAATRMNADSSRSHSVIQIVVSQKNLQDGSAKSGRLSLVDLAGSEKVGKTGAEGQTLEEAKKINKSLSALGNVINALTDSKASHVPYRDSKLTRVLQESLGGNSRTTIIINCSPSSYNAPETVSSLRFGARAKSIKNKARVNEELSADELRRRWEDARKDVARLKGILAKAEAELKMWRAGTAVPQSAWTSFASVADADGGDEAPQQAPAPAAAVGAPSPAPGVTSDERQEFIDRENELVDEISEKDKLIAEMRAELDVLRANKDGLDAFAKENANLAAEVSELQRRVDAVLFENKELELTVESLNDSKAAMVAEMAALKTALDTAQSRADSEADGAKERAERVARMMESLDEKGQELEARERQLRESLAEAVTKEEPKGPSVEEHQALQAALATAESDAERLRTQIAQLEATVESVTTATRQADRLRREAEERADKLQTECQEMLGRMIEFESKAQVDEDNKSSLMALKKSLEDQIAAAKAAHQKQLADLRDDLVAARNEAERLALDLAERQRANDELQAANTQSRTVVEDQARKLIEMAKSMESRSRAEVELEALKQTTAKQLKEFDQLKEALMTDLKNRCEKVIDLEISLDQSRDQYNQLLNSSANKAQQKKMAFLEKNLEQLTQVHQQLVNQNTQLKLDVAVAEKKLAARNSRIKHLEVLVQDAQEKLARQSARSRAEMERLREQLAASKSVDTRARPFDWAPGAAASTNIAKPIRGGARSGSFYLKSMMGTPAPANDAPAAAPSSDASPSTPKPAAERPSSDAPMSFWELMTKRGGQATPAPATDDQPGGGSPGSTSLPSTPIAPNAARRTVSAITGSPSGSSAQTGALGLAQPAAGTPVTLARGASTGALGGRVPVPTAPGQPITLTPGATAMVFKASPVQVVPGDESGHPLIHPRVLPTPPAGAARSLPTSPHGAPGTAVPAQPSTPVQGSAQSAGTTGRVLPTPPTAQQAQRKLPQPPSAEGSKQ